MSRKHRSQDPGPQDQPTTPWFLQDLRPPTESTDSSWSDLFKPGAEPQTPCTSPPTSPRGPRSEPRTPTTSRPSTPRLEEVAVQIPRIPRPIPAPVRQPAEKPRELEILPDRVSNTIQRVVTYRIRKPQKARTRPRLTKDPLSSPWYCKLCKVAPNGKAQYFQHLHSAKHRKRANRAEFKCETCHLQVSSKEDLKRHYSSKGHKLAAKWRYFN